jgi:hypothetical protein
VSIDFEHGPAHKAPTRLTLRLGVLLMAAGGVLHQDLAVQVAEEQGTGSRTPARRLQEAMRPMRTDGVVLRVGDTWYAPDLPDLAAWVADAYAYRWDAGYGSNPVVPAEPPAAAAA